MILPKELYEIMEKGMNDMTGFFAESRNPVYSRVVLPLSALLEGEFFTEYIKRGRRHPYVLGVYAFLRDTRECFDAFEGKDWG